MEDADKGGRRGLIFGASRSPGTALPGRPQLVFAGAIGVAVVLGATAAAQPMAAAGLAGLVVFAALVSVGSRSGSLFLGGLGVLLIGYAFVGRGFAYIGVPPLFVGELLLLVGVVALVANLHRLRFGFTVLLLLAFIVVGVVRTVPYIGPYSFDALRDAVVWGYALFALTIACTVERRHLDTLVAWYGRMLPAFVLWVPVAFILAIAAGGVFRAPGSETPFIVPKAGDMAVHLTGVAAFILVGLWGRRTALDTSREVMLWGAWIAGIVAAGALNRGGLLAATLGVGLALAMRPTRRFATALFAGTLIVILFIMVDPQIDLGTERRVSIDQITSNVRSLISDTDNTSLEATSEWRMEWWREIVDYTVRGPYFWGGKGFGINLADDDGFQVLQDQSLRAPHNGHLNILARMGVPALALWIVLQVAFAVGMLRVFVRSRARKQLFWTMLSAWLLVYWVAMIVNMSFDVYLEGPQGGIWFWSVFGLGLAVFRLHKDEPIPDVAHVHHAAVSTTRSGS